MPGAPAWHASLQGFEAVQSPKLRQFLRVATKNCGAIEFAVEIPISIDTFLLCGGRCVSVRRDALESRKKSSGADQ
jgi:hypothetical protein